MSTLGFISDWLATLPPFGGAPPNIEIFTDGKSACLYRLEWGGGLALLKRYKATSSPARTGADKRRAEAAALTHFAPLGLAPELLWEGVMPGSMDDALIYRWAEGTRAADQVLTNDQLELLAAALRTVHSDAHNPKLLSPAPRTLEGWWGHTHELYRDMQMRLATEMPIEISDTLSRLLQPVSGDVQAHKRFWQGAPLTLVHGRPEPANMILSEDQVILKNWQDFGLGDPSYELAAASRLLAEQLGEEEPARHFVDSYLDGTEDNMLARRVEIYRRVWPFGYLLSTIKSYLDQIHRLPVTPHEARSIAFHFRDLLTTYEWPGPTSDRVVAVLGEWLADKEENRANGTDEQTASRL
jgi:hypothetical protein